MRLWNLRSHKQIGPAIQVDYGYDVAFSTDSRTLITAGFDVHLWNVRTHQQVGRSACHTRFGLAAVALASDGHTLACARAADSPTDPSLSLVLWNTRTHRGSH